MSHTESQQKIQTRVLRGGRRLRTPALSALAGLTATGAFAGVALASAAPSTPQPQAAVRSAAASKQPPDRAGRGGRRTPLPAKSAKPKPTDKLVRRNVAVGPVETGEASFYGGGDGFDGGTTANGETFDAAAMTAAHPSLPFGTLVRVCWQDHGSCVTVRINDRGPYHGGRIIDLSVGAAARLGLAGAGVGEVTVTPVELRSVRVPASR